MKRSLIVVPLIVVVAAAAILFLGGPSREFTTTSSEAYEAYQQGYSQSLAFQFAQAESSLTLATRLDPNFAMAQAQLAAIYQRDRSKDLIDAQVTLADSLSRSLPNDVERAKIQLVLCGLRQSHGARRDSILQFLTEEEPNNLLVLTALGNSLYQKDNDRAREIFTKILSIEPNNAPAYNMLGYMSATEGDFETAISYLRKYAFLAPDLANPHDSLGQVLSWMGEYEESEHEYLAALNVEPDFYYSLVGLSNIYLEQGMLNKGIGIIDELRPLISGTPMEKAIDQTVIRNQYSFELYDESYAGIARFVEKYPNDYSTPFYRVITAAIEERYAEADSLMASFMVSAREMAKKSGNERSINNTESLQYQYEAWVASFQGRHADAAVAWSQYRDLRGSTIGPEEKWWDSWRESESRMAAGELVTAMQLSMAALEMNPHRIRPLLVIATAAIELQQFEVARTAMDQLAPLMAKADSYLPAQSTYRDLQARLQQLAAN
jgi:tetratricopeptide (TPR) repeat protein